MGCISEVLVFTFQLPFGQGSSPSLSIRIVPDSLPPLPVCLTIDRPGRIIRPDLSLLYLRPVQLLWPWRPLVSVQPVPPHPLCLLISSPDLFSFACSHDLFLHLGVCLMHFLLGSIHGLIQFLSLDQTGCL